MRAPCWMAGHDWTEWSRWYLLEQPVAPHYVMTANDPPPSPAPLPAERERLCRTCGLVQVMDYGSHRVTERR